MHAPFWLTTALLSPILLYQGKRARRITPRLPEASGATSGQYGTGAPKFRLLVIGESTAAGVGVATHNDGLASQLALRLNQRTDKTIAWQTFGVNGIRLGNLLQTLAAANLPPTDSVLLSMGVNDTTGFTTRAQFRQHLQALRSAIAPLSQAPITLLSVPPMEKFSALPPPLRNVMGWRARQLDRIYQELAQQAPADFRYLNYPTVENPSLLAKDGFHPSHLGYQFIAEALAQRDWGV